MAMRCTICRSPARAAIESAIVQQMPYRAIGRTYGVGYRSVMRHLACMRRLIRAILYGDKARPSRTPMPAWLTYCRGPDGQPRYHAPGRRYCRQCWPPRGRGKGEHNQSPRRRAAWGKSYQACLLRGQDKTYAEIAHTLGYADASGAYRAIQRFLPGYRG